jgi:large subunit ribosomal protein L14
MIQMNTMVDVADNTGAKQAMVIDIYKGGASGVGKRRLRRAGLGDLLLVTVKKALPNARAELHENRLPG